MIFPGKNARTVTREELVSRNELALVSLGNATHSDRWKPISHQVLATMIVEELVKAGLQVKAEQYFLCKSNREGLIGDVTVGVPDSVDMQKIGLVEVAQGLEKAGMGMHVAFRHSNDLSWALKIVAGAEVFVCSNGVMKGAFGGELPRKKHLTSLDLQGHVTSSIQAMLYQFQDLLLTQQKAKEMDVSLKEGDHLILEAGRKKILPWRYIEKVASEWKEPKHSEFKDKNGWSLLNAFTEVIKQRPPTSQPDDLTAIHLHLLGDKK